MARCLHSVSPEGWRQIKLHCRSVGRHHEVSGRITFDDGRTELIFAPLAAYSIFDELRRQKHHPNGPGTWFTAEFWLEPNRYQTQYDHDFEPAWDRVPPPRAFAEELKLYPRVKDNTPVWLADRTAGRTPSPPPAFREAKVFDGRDGTGRPVVNRSQLPAHEIQSLASYLEQAPMVLRANGAGQDEFAPGAHPEVPLTFHTDGQWIWPGSVHYYLRKYGLPPEQDLVTHIRSLDYSLGQPSESVQRAAVSVIVGRRPATPATPKPTPADPPPLIPSPSGNSAQPAENHQATEAPQPGTPQPEAPQAVAPQPVAEQAPAQQAPTSQAGFPTVTPPGGIPQVTPPDAPTPVAGARMPQPTEQAPALPEPDPVAAAEVSAEHEDFGPTGMGAADIETAASTGAHSLDQQPDYSSGPDAEENGRSISDALSPLSTPSPSQPVAHHATQPEQAEPGAGGGQIVHGVDDEEAIILLRQRLDDLGVRPDVYGIGAPAPSGGPVLERRPDGRGWQVTTTGGPIRFEMLRDAASYFIGTLVISPKETAVHDADPSRPTEWPFQPLPGEPPLSLFRDRKLVALTPGTEVDRFGDPTGNLTYAARTMYTNRSLPPDYLARPYHAYRVERLLQAIKGTAVPWFGQAGGGTGYLLPRSINELLTDGSLVEISETTTEPPQPQIHADGG
jgi:hypothetical protein